MTEVRIIIPGGTFGASADDDVIDTAMRVIGVGFGSEDEWASKYGTNFENEVFLMHRYCWCEEGNCPWCAGCYCESNDWRGGEKAPAGRKCDWCAGIHKWADKGALPPDQEPHYGAPHFWFKPSGFRLWWYKYIGRDMQAHGGDLPGDFMRQIFATHPSGMTVEQAIEKTAHQEKETAKGFAAMFASLGIQTA